MFCSKEFFKKHKSNIYGALFLLAVWILLELTFLAPPPWKVVDPADPRFNPDAFSFSDYPSREEMVEAFRKLFPVGTPKEFVDRVLISAGNAEGGHASKTLPQLVNYWHPQIYYLPKGPMHQFIFSDQGKLLNIELNATDVLYPDQITHQDLINIYEENQNDR